VDVSLGGFSINEYGLEDFTVTIVYLPEAIVFPPESDEQYPSAETDYHYKADDDTWWARTVFTCIAKKTEDNASGIQTWVHDKLNGWTDSDGNTWTTSHLIKGGDIHATSFLNGAKAYTATMQWKKASGWAPASAPGPSDFGLLNEGAIE
jgi:hypothetical protein